MRKFTDDLLDHIPHLRRYALVLKRNQASADDLVQDCLERAIERMHQYQPGTNMRAWLFKVLHNLHISECRQAMRRGREVELDTWVDDNSCSAAQETRLEFRDFQRAFESLPETHRSVLILVGAEGFSYTEAAETLGVPVGTIRSRLSRAREMLRTAQNEGLGHPGGVAHLASQKPFRRGPQANLQAA